MATTPQKTPLVSIIILNYHTDEMTLKLVKKIQSDEDVEVVLVDNSDSKTLEHEAGSLNHTVYVNPGSNLGFAGGVNVGIHKSRGEWIFLLNSDADADISTIKNLIKKCIDKNIKVGAPRLVGNEGTIEKSVGRFSLLFENPINWLFMRPKYILPETESLVHTGTGGALLIHRSIIEKVGVLDDKNFFMYFEDMDYSWRLHNAGVDILYIPSCVITHIGGGSADKNPTKKKQSYLTSLDNYLLKHRGPLVLWLNSIFHFLR
ncbi:MAG: glycosyltransferase family 2 protein [bacterium]